MGHKSYPFMEAPDSRYQRTPWSHCPGLDAKAQRGEGAYSRPHSKPVAEPGIELHLLTPATGSLPSKLCTKTAICVGGVPHLEGQLRQESSRDPLGPP